MTPMKSYESSSPGDDCHTPIWGAGSAFERGSGTVILSENLFGGRQQIVIAHAGGLYLLRQTRNGKLILTK